MVLKVIYLDNQKLITQSTLLYVSIRYLLNNNSLNY